MSNTINYLPLGGAQVSTPLQGYGGAARTSPTTVTLGPDAPVQTVNLTTLPSGQQIGAIVTVYVDNSAGPIPVEIIFPDTGQNSEVPAYCQGFFPALTNGRVFNVAAPLAPELQATFNVIVQALNFAIPQALYGPFLPNGNTGSLDTPGSAGSWTSLTRTVPPSPPNAIAISYQSLEINCLGFGGSVEVTGFDLSGNPWTVNQLPLTKSEFAIPATGTGSSYTITQTIPDGGATLAVIPLRWRPALAGEQPSYNVPLYMPSIVTTETSMSSGTTSFTLLPATAGLGFFIDNIYITAAGWSAQYNVALVDAGNSLTIWEGAFPSGNSAGSADIGYVAFERNQNLMLNVQNAGAAAGTLSINVRASYLTASQNG